MKNTIAICFVFILLLMFVGCGFDFEINIPENRHESGDYVYQELYEDGKAIGAKIIEINGESAEAEVLEIPSELDGLPVLEIGGYLGMLPMQGVAIFKINASKIIIPSTVNSIGRDAFDFYNKILEIWILGDDVVDYFSADLNDETIIIVETPKWEEYEWGQVYPISKIQDGFLIDKNKLIRYVGNKEIQTLIVPECIEMMSHAALYQLPNIKNIFLPSSLLNANKGWNQARNDNKMIIHCKASQSADIKWSKISEEPMEGYIHFNCICEIP